jgi:hypothetical protein
MTLFSENRCAREVAGRRGGDHRGNGINGCFVYEPAAHASAATLRALARLVNQAEPAGPALS